MANPQLDQITRSLMWMLLPLMVLAGIANALPKRRSRAGARRRNGAASLQKGGWADDLVLAPWWISFGLAGAALIFLPVLLPRPMQGLALIVVFFLLAISALSALRKWKTRRMLDEQTSLASITELSPKRFEDLLGEAYRRQGYKVEEMLGGGADGGVDLVLRRDGNVTLVQAKRWRDRPVPVQIVRELYGVMHDRAVSAGKLVTTSSFTSEAVVFAKGKPIELLGSAELLHLIASVQTAKKIAATPPSLPKQYAAVNPPCPKCGSTMVMRTAKRGSTPGLQFWGCLSFPKCRGTREIG
jgi:restriction system protein